MTTAALVSVALVALLHLYFLVLEMLLWTMPYGRRTFGLTPERASDHAVARRESAPPYVLPSRR